MSKRFIFLVLFIFLLYETYTLKGWPEALMDFSLGHFFMTATGLSSAVQSTTQTGKQPSDLSYPQDQSQSLDQPGGGDQDKLQEQSQRIKDLSEQDRLQEEAINQKMADLAEQNQMRLLSYTRNDLN